MILILSKNDVLFKKNFVIFKNENERRQTVQTNQIPLKKRKKNQNALMFKYSSKENFENMFHYLFFFHLFGFCYFISSFKDAAQPEICIEIDFGIY